MPADESAFVAGRPIDNRLSSQIAGASRAPFGDFEAKAGRVVGRVTGERVTLQDDNSSSSIPASRRSVRLTYPLA